MDRSQAAMLGVNVGSIGQMVQMVTNGVMIGEYRPDDADDELEIRLRHPQQDRHGGPTTCGSTPVLAQCRSAILPSGCRQGHAIQRMDMVRRYYAANTEDGYLTDNQARQIARWLETQDIDDRSVLNFAVPTRSRRIRPNSSAGLTGYVTDADYAGDAV